MGPIQSTKRSDDTLITHATQASRERQEVVCIDESMGNFLNFDPSALALKGRCLDTCSLPSLFNGRLVGNRQQSDIGDTFQKVDFPEG